jgi:glycosyltransferase involved in cell wall biosynthesis
MKEPHIPKVSVGMPVYNGGDLLKTAIDSILSQDFADFELIISDNASTDSTESVCRIYAEKDSRITCVRRDRNYGMVNNGRHVLSLARGEYFMMAAHDDQRYPRFISACVEKLDANPALALVSPAVEFFAPDGTILNIPYPPLHTVGMGVRERVASIFKEINVGFNSYGMYRREILNKIDFDVECFANDVVFLLQLMFLGEVEHIPEKLFRYRFIKRTTQEHIAAVSADAAKKHPTKLYTILTINLLRAIFKAPVVPAMKRILVSDALSIITLKNLHWRRMLLSENPSIGRFLEPEQNGCTASVEVNLVSEFASLLLPYCYPGAPYEGAMDFSAIEGITALPAQDSKKPGPGHQEFIATFRHFLENGKIAQALAYHDAYRGGQPASPAVRQVCDAQERLRPLLQRKTTQNSTVQPPPSHRLRIAFVVRPEDMLEAEMATVYKDTLERNGHKVTVVMQAPTGLLGFDIVHAFNLARQGEDTRLLDNALIQRKPLIITALHRDLNRYGARAIHSLKVFQAYIENGQLPDTFDRLWKKIPLPVIAPPSTENLSARYSSMVCASCATEEEQIRRLFPGAKVSIIPFYALVPPEEIAADPFVRQFHIKDFVLCMGPLEIESNQLILLKALENEEIPVVVADGGMTAQPGYETLCRKLKRRGPTIFTGALAPEMLLSAIRAARVFCAPGWHEQPRPALLAAARFGCAIATSGWGYIHDYFGDQSTYFEPDSIAAVHDSVLNAWSTGPKPGQKSITERFNENETGMRLEMVYRELVS